LLIRKDKSLLGDGFLEGAESVAKIKEQNRAMNANRKQDQQEWLSNKEAGRGRPIMPMDFIRTLHKLNPNFMCKSLSVWGRPSIALYIFDGVEPQYVGGFFTDLPLPEYTTYDEPDNVGLVSRTTRGWREVLVMLIKAGAISRVGADEKLGPAMGARAEGAWDKQLQGR
jgi:hypothetical protein